MWQYTAAPKTYWTTVTSHPISGLKQLETASSLLLSAASHLCSHDVEIDYNEMLTSLDTSLMRTLSVIRGLLNGARTINRIPTEILLHIFSMVPERKPFISDSDKAGAHWPFCVLRHDDLMVLSQVCRHWREAVLGAPALCVAGSQEEELLSSVVSMDHSSLRHCCFLLPQNVSERLLSSPLFTSGFGTNLRSLLLSCPGSVPQCELPALTRCVLSSPTQIYQTNIDPGEILGFLSRTPRLATLHIYRISLRTGLREGPALAPIKVELNNLKYFSYDAPSNHIPSLADFYSHIVTQRHCRLDVNRLDLHNPESSGQHPLDVSDLVRSLRGTAASPTKLGIHMKKEGDVKTSISLEIPDDGSNGRVDSTQIVVSCRYGTSQLFWSSLLTAEFCQNIREMRIDVRDGRLGESAGELVALWPMLQNVQRLSIAFRWSWSHHYMPSVIRTLQPLFTPEHGLAILPSLDTLDVYVDDCENEVVECLTELLSFRAANGKRIRRLDLFVEDRVSTCVQFPREYVDDFVFLPYMNFKCGQSWKEWPRFSPSVDYSQFIGADWPTWC
ncbi:hypothetical protein C8Q76DRAFT_698676 [Earliella scabrosa]|nr:hypothetical protein C8Q76DRAFT_698676 [Earliella scabrosa]